MLDFIDLARGRSKAYAPYEFQAQMQGYCTLLLWRWAASPQGSVGAFADWCARPSLMLAHRKGLQHLSASGVSGTTLLLSVFASRSRRLMIVIAAARSSQEAAESLPERRC